MIIALIVLSIFLTLFPIVDAGLSITYSDVMLGILLPFFIRGVVRKELVITSYAKAFLLFILVLLLSSVVNMTYFEGQFLNIFRTAFMSWVLFTWIYNLVLTGRVARKHYYFSITVMALCFIFKTWNEMQIAFTQTEAGFTSVNVFESSLNLNVWGFILYLFFVFFSYFWSIKYYKKLNTLFLLIVGGLTLYSLSRTAWSLLGLAVVYILGYANKSSVKSTVALVSTGVVLFLALRMSHLVSFEISESALDFFKSKSSNYDADLVDVRFYMINILPIVENFEAFNPVQILLGDGYNVQHSWVSHTLVVSGIIGFLTYVHSYRILITGALRRMPLFPLGAKFILLLAASVLINDFMTNISFFSPFAAYLSFSLMAIILAETDKFINHARIKEFRQAHHISN